MSTRRTRRYGEGTISSYETKAGTRYRVRWYEPGDPDDPASPAVRRTRNALASYEDAVDILATIRLALRNGQSTQTGVRDQTVGSYMAAYLASFRGADTTKSGYERSARLHVLPYLRHVRLASVRPSTLAALYRVLENGGEIKGVKCAGGLGPNTVLKVHYLLSGMFRMAVEEGLIAASPVANRAANPPTLDEVRDAATPRKVWDSSELSLFLSWAHENSTYWPLWETAAGTGMRRGELCGLKWGDVDLHENMLHVVHSLAQVKTKGAGYKLVEKGTKSSKPRSITFGPRVRKALLEQRRRAAAGGLGNVRDNKPVFTTRRLKPWIPDSMTRSWEDTVDVFTVAHPNVEPITLQGLRHTHATILIMELNTSVKAVQERLGHSDVSTTLRVYTHVGRDRHQRIADDFERLIVG